ncbi:alpha/beta fold hydrolase [Streptomyces cyaneofuscatus]|uniref:alpha/beta fold hydrolase n=1 Tax=Streptomyces cyaneofuscatus TaxID=66883 RepID=UPI003660C880
MVAVSGFFPPRAWDHSVVPSLTSAGYRVVTFSHRGMPPSHVSRGGYTIEQLADDCVGLMLSLGFSKFFALGASMGGLIVQRMLLSNPDPVIAAACINGMGNYSAAGRILVEANFELCRLEETPAALHRLISYMGVQCPQYKENPEFYNKMIGAMTKEGLPPLQGRIGLSGALVHWGQTDHMAEIADISVPCLALGSVHDHIFPSSLILEYSRLAEAIVYHELCKSPHIFFLEAQEALAPVLDFFSGQLKEA